MKALLLILSIVSLKVSAGEPVKSQAADQASLNQSSSVETTIAKADNKIYGLVLSTHKGPADYDVFVSRRVNDIYSFKYCRVYNSKAQPTKVADIRLKYLMGQLINDDTQKFLEKLFLSEDCQSIGATAYAAVANGDLPSCGPDQSGNGAYEAGSVGSGVVGALAGYVFLYDIKHARAGSNTESFFRFVFSKKISYGYGAASVAFLGASAGLGYMAFKVLPEKYEGTGRLAVVSYCLGQGSSTVIIEDSMESFLKFFKTGLNYAVKTGAFSAI